MSVSQDVQVRPRMWRGYDDPGLPIGTYFASFTIIGDGTGGTMQVNFIYKNAGQPANGNFYNIEQLNAFITVAAPAQAGFIRALNFETLDAPLPIEQQWRFLFSLSLPAASSITELQQIPIFLGQTDRIFATQSSAQVGTANAAIVAMGASIQGYIWSARSVMAQGGLRRPVDALYGRG